MPFGILGRVRGHKIPIVFNLGTRGREASGRPPHTPVTLPQVKQPRYPWVDPRAGLDVLEKSKTSLPCWLSEPCIVQTGKVCLEC